MRFPFGFRCNFVISFATSLQSKEAHMATKKSGGGATIVAIIVILLIAVGAYFVFANNTSGAGGGGVQSTLGVSTLPVMDPTTAPYSAVKENL
jgi:hypothetical protein